MRLYKPGIIIIICLLLAILMQNIANSSDILWANRRNSDYNISGTELSKDGRYFVSLIKTDNTKLIVYDLDQDKIVWSDTGKISSCSISPDGNYITYSKDSAGTVLNVIDLVNDKTVMRYHINYYPKIDKLKFSNKGDKIVAYIVSMNYKVLLLFDVNKKLLLDTLITDKIYDLYFSNDDAQLYLSCYKQSSMPPYFWLYIVNFGTCEYIKKISNDYPISDIFPDGSQYITYDTDSNNLQWILFRNIDNNNIIKKFETDWISITKFSISPDYSKIAFGIFGFGGGIITYNYKESKIDKKYPAIYYPDYIKFIGNTNKIFYSTSNNIRILDLNTGITSNVMNIDIGNNHSGSVYSLAISPDNKIVASAGVDETIKLWDAATGSFIKEFVDSNACIDELKFSEDGKYLYSVAVESKSNLKVWDVETGKNIKNIRFPKQDISQSFLSNNRKLLVYSTSDTFAYFFDIDSEKFIDSINLDIYNYNIKLSPSNNYLIGHNFSVQVWKKVNNKYVIDSLSFQNRMPVEMDISRNDSLMACVPNVQSFDAIHLYTLNPLSFIPEFYADSFSVNELQFSYDMHYLLAYSTSQIRVYNLLENNVQHSYEELPNTLNNRIRTMLLSDDNKILVTGHFDGSVIRWKTDWSTEIADYPNDKNNLLIYPNPADDILHIRCDYQIDDISITDVLGKSIKLRLNSNSSGLYSFDISGLYSGIYMLSINSGNQYKNIKFIKE